MILSEICAEIKNYFTYDRDKVFGSFSIQSGQIVPEMSFPTDYIRISGSRLNDGVHKLSDADLVDEPEFSGSVWIMSPPRDFLDLVDEISKWIEVNGRPDSAAMSPFSSESFGGYSYSKGAAASTAGSGGAVTWKSVYGKRLNIYRRILL